MITCSISVFAVNIRIHFTEEKWIIDFRMTRPTFVILRESIEDLILFWFILMFVDWPIKSLADTSVDR